MVTRAPNAQGTPAAPGADLGSRAPALPALLLGGRAFPGRRLAVTVDADEAGPPGEAHPPAEPFAP